MAGRKGATGFESFYSEQFGPRWPALRSALLAKSQHPLVGRVIRENGFAGEFERSRAFGDYEAGPVPQTWHLSAAALGDARDGQNLALGYVMDPASLLAAQALDLSEAQNVLDLCAAPGGKSLVLLENLPRDAALTVNDRSKDRLARLRKVLHDYVPSETLERVHVTCVDGRRVGLMRRGQFDRILLDAPCSSEGHVLADAQALAEWSESRVSRLAQDQYALLTSALLALAPGGRLVYSTCALTRAENDGIIEKLLTKGRHPATVVAPPAVPFGECTEYGVQVLPDETSFGPIYFCILEATVR